MRSEINIKLYILQIIYQEMQKQNMTVDAAAIALNWTMKRLIKTLEADDIDLRSLSGLAYIVGYNLRVNLLDKDIDKN